VLIVPSFTVNVQSGNFFGEKIAVGYRADFDPFVKQGEKWLFIERKVLVEGLSDFS